MLAMGKSKPWPEELDAISGMRQMDATAILDYFAPLKQWLHEPNKGEKPGWQTMDAPLPSSNQEASSNSPQPAFLYTKHQVLSPIPLAPRFDIWLAKAPN